MDESQSLDALANIMNDVAEKPFDFALHVNHIRLAASVPGMDAEATAAREMMTQCFTVGDDVWLPLLDAKEKDLDLESEEGVNDLLATYAAAEADYLSIPLLEKHLNFLIDRHEHYSSGENLRPNTLGEVFTTEWTREALDGVVKKGAIHLTRSNKLWEPRKDWELEMLESAPPKEKPKLVEHIQNLLQQRLKQTHSTMDETMQAYSTFTTNNYPAQDYENAMVNASKMRGQSVRNYERREPHEINLTQTQNSLEAFNQYITYERRAKHPDLFVTRGIYERAISEAAKRRFHGEAGAEDALRLFWMGYCDVLPGLDAELETQRRAVKSVPGSGELWARYIRLLERLQSSGELFEGIESISDVFDRAISTKLIQTDSNQLIPVILARAGYEKRQLEAGVDVEEALPQLIGLLETGISWAYEASKTIDPTLKLEKFLTHVAEISQKYESTGLIDSIFDVWKAASKHSKSSYVVWLNYTEALIKHQKHNEARQLFSEISTKNLDWPEALWDAWISFEQLHGSVETIDEAMDKVEKAQQAVQTKRAKEAKRAAEEYQANMAHTVVPADVEKIIMDARDSVGGDVEMAAGGGVKSGGGDASMQVDQVVAVVERGKKRGADDDEGSADTHKKARFEEKPAPPKRDRENSTVFVGDLPSNTTEADLVALFKDCGPVREVKFTKLAPTLVATVEFVDRESVPAGLTKDKKRVHDQEIAVHLAWKSTMYITNFPESTDDAYIRNLFGKYGIVFDVRWPSKKFKSTRRFCYVQFTSPAAAEKALELHGRELEPNLPLNVYISNPERKKERTDQDANEKEVYVAGLSRFTNKGDLEKLFATYGTVKDVRIALDEAGHARGYAFVEFEEPAEAQRALSANNHELKKRRIGVTLVDPRVRARHKSEIGLSRIAETRSRSVYVRNLPPSTQEGLLQQALEKIIPVKRVEVFLDRQEATVELENPADAGRLLLRTEPIIFGGNTLVLSEDAKGGIGAATQNGSGSAGSNPASFKPRKVGPSKPKAGLGFKKTPITGGAEGNPGQGASRTETAAAAVPAGSSGKGQDDFRKMLSKK
ncbi:hypothetical protein CPB83DRAFT_934295 [Crepidotus variabilis]|uniref:U4/U6 snRNA-associated-splicing factor PRP24 n=1 Tax=Crepidotus variabilis TaxID=179855 RepID=A0A9P6EF50_9AGAR|nr:hypothetical protein CPB83DRAFT_934295 [Crepidotus variabilis]